MPGFSSTSNGQAVVYAENVDFSGATLVGNTITTNGQLIIGSTSLNAGGTHINIGKLVSPLGTLSIGYSSPNITLDLMGGTDDLHVARYIVSAGGGPNGANYTTIAAAYAAAVVAGAPQTVFVQPGIYTENITLTAGINISAFSGDAYSPSVSIVGKLSGTYSGDVTITGIRLITNGDFALQVSGAASTQLFIKDCWIDVHDHTFLSMTSSGGGSAQFQDCFGNTDAGGIAYFSATSGLIRIISCYFLNDGGTSTASTITTGTLTIFGSNFGSPITASSNGNIGIEGSTIGEQLTLNNTGSNVITRSQILENVNTALVIGAGVTVTAADLTIFTNAVNAISGTGTLSTTPISFTGSSSTIQGTLTVTALPFHPLAGVTQFDVLVGAASGVVASVGPGTAGQVLQSGGNAANPAYSTATFPATATSTGTILRADGTNWVATTATYPATTTANQLLYSSATNVVGGLATANNGILNTDGSGVPSITASPTIGANNAGTLVTIASNSVTALALDNGVAHGTIPLIDLYHDASTVATDYAYEIDFNAKNSTPAKKTFASIQGQVAVNTAAAEMGSFIVNTINAGASQQNIIVGNNLGQYRGTQGSTAPPAGFLGEQITANATLVSLTNNTPKNITSINLTPGIWDVTGHGTSAGTGISAGFAVGISTTSNTLGASPGVNYGFLSFNPALTSGDFDIAVPQVRATLAATTTYYLVAQATFSTGTTTANGIISATRVG